MGSLLKTVLIFLHSPKKPSKLLLNLSPNQAALWHCNENKILSIPVHRNQDLKIGTLKSIMKTAQLTEDDLF